MVTSAFFFKALGPLASGKSTIINAILGQLELTTGTLKVGGTIGYVPQTPWIQHGTVRENILFGKEMDPDWYKLVLYCCALDIDLPMLADGNK